MRYAFGLIGYPITHSLSPWIHGEFLKRTNLQGTYDIFEIDVNDSFKEEMMKLRDKSLDGFNVTVPYKEKIMPFLDEIDEQAKEIGAVNTVWCKDGKWTGYNTDGIGYVRSLESKYPIVQGNLDARILLLGAGGAAKGIYAALKASGRQNITIANRSIEKAVQLTGLPEKSMHLQEAEKLAHTFDLIIQTSSVGMKPNVNQAVINLTHVKKDAIVSDIVYQPLKTKLLQTAENLGAHIHFGHTMLLYQAQYAFEIWTNEQPNMDQLDIALQQILEG